MKKVHVIIVGGGKEDISWVNNLIYPSTLYLFKNLPEGIAPNLGREYYPFYKWIYDNYDGIHEYDYLILAHAHRTFWHCNVNIDELINNLLFHYKYENINIFPHQYYPEAGHLKEDWTLVNCKQVDKDKQRQFKIEEDFDFYQTFFSYKFEEFLDLFGIEQFPLEEIIGKRCGQCYVSTDLILNKSKDFWKKLIDFFTVVPHKLYEERPDVIQFFTDNECFNLLYPCALLFEIINHYIFTGFKDYRDVFQLSVVSKVQ